MAHDHVFDPHNILAGSDNPYFQNMGNRRLYNRAVDYVVESGLNDEAINNILVHNPARLLGIA